jgi:hypothetical protein
MPPKKLAACRVKQSDEVLKPFIDLPQEINLREDQKNDDQIRKLRNRLAKGTATVTEDRNSLKLKALCTIFPMETPSLPNLDCIFQEN